MTLHQLNMDDIWSRPAARNTDPVTSRMAAEKAALGASRDRLAVLAALLIRPMNDFEIAEHIGRVQTSAGKRRGELRDHGYVEVARDGRGNEATRLSPNKSPSLIWQITAAGREFYAKHQTDAARSAA